MHAACYFKEAELPFQFALANAFTICDAYPLNNEWDSIDASTLGYEWKTYPSACRPPR